MGEQAPLLQFLHHAADRGRREADAAGERLRPDRQPALEIGFDHPAENLAHAVGQFADGLGHVHPSRIAALAGLGTRPHQYQEIMPLCARPDAPPTKCAS